MIFNCDFVFQKNFSLNMRSTSGYARSETNKKQVIPPSPPTAWIERLLFLSHLHPDDQHIVHLLQRAFPFVESGRELFLLLTAVLRVNLH